MTDAPLPFTPRGLRAELAALYCGVSAAWWREQHAKGAVPRPVYLTPRLPVWLRDDLDAWLDARAGRVAASAPNPWDAPPDAPRRAPPPR